MATVQRIREAGLGDRIRRALDSDLWYSFTRSPVTVVSAMVTAAILLAAVLAPWVAPHDPFDLASIDLLDASLPPVWMADGDSRFPSGPTTRAGTCGRRSSSGPGSPSSSASRR